MGPLVQHSSRFTTAKPWPHPALLFRSQWAVCMVLGGLLTWRLLGLLRWLGYPATWLEAVLLAVVLTLLPFAAPPKVLTAPPYHAVQLAAICLCACGRDGV